MIRKRSPCLPHKRDQPLSENSMARIGEGGVLIVIQYSNTCLKSFRTLSLNSEGMLRGIDNCYFILITFSFKLKLVLINRVINILQLGYPYDLFASHQCMKYGVFSTRTFIYAPLHEMNAILRMFGLSHFCCSQEYMQNNCFIHS